MPRAGIFVLLWSLMTCSLGFTMDRSALVLSTWDAAPSLDTYQRIPAEPASNSKIPTTSTEKSRPAEDAKVLTKMKESMQESQTRERRSTTENVEVKLIGDVASTAKNDDSLGESNDALAAPRNVVLLLIDDKDLDKNRRENPWQDLTEMSLFTVQGSLQSCGDKIGTIDISSEDVLLSEGKEKDCNCERLLYSNIGELLSWAKYTRQMATGAVSGSKFNTPLLLDYVAASSDILTGLDGSNEGDAKLELRKSKTDSSDSWQVLDLGSRAKFIPTLVAPQRGGTTNYDGAWDIFDVLSKIKMAFFRSLLESLGRKDGTFEDKSSPRTSFPLKPTVVNLIRSIISELKFISKHKGYTLIAVVPRNEQVVVVNLLQREISADTLLVVTETCSGNNKSIVPFVARGPNEQNLRQAKTIWQLPAAIRNAIAGGCHEPGCPPNRQRRNVPAVSRAPTEISARESPTWKRVIRDQNAAEELNTTNVEETTIVEIQARSSTTSETTSYDLVTLLGIATSLLAVVALTSS